MRQHPSLYRHLFIFSCLVAALTQSSPSQAATAAGAREGGEGFYVAGDKGFSLSIQGYSQFLMSILSSDYNIRDTRADQPVGFSLRRARFDLLSVLYNNLELLVEVGTPTLPLRGVGSDLGIIEARATSTLFGEALSLRAGKFVVPFSGENSHSSRRLDTVERASVLNAMIAANNLDTQLGLMLFGRIPNGIFNYYMGIFNGNTSNLTTSGDDNGHKQFQAKLVFQPHRVFTFGFAYDTDTTRSQALTLYDHAFAPYVTGNVVGRRHGLETDWNLSINWFSWKTEGMYFTFPEVASGSLRYLWGGYTQFGFFLTGDQTYGFQTLIRGEFARADFNSNVRYDLASSVLAFNAYINANLNLAINYIAEFPSNANGSGAYRTAQVKHMLLSQMQVKF